MIVVVRLPKSNGKMYDNGRYATGKPENLSIFCAARLVGLR